MTTKVTMSLAQRESDVGGRTVESRRTYRKPAKAQHVSSLCISILEGDSSDTHRREGRELPPLSTFGVLRGLPQKKERGILPGCKA